MPSVEKLRKSDALAKELGDRDAQEYLRSCEAAEERRKHMVFEARVFTERDGVPIHWTVGGEDVGTLENNVSDLVEWLEANEFKAHTGFGNGGGNASVPRQTTRSQNRPAFRKPANGNGSGNKPRQQQRGGVVCAYCEGPTWDNRAKKDSGEFKAGSPDFACKDRDGCGGAAWYDDDGELDWRAGD